MAFRGHFSGFQEDSGNFMGISGSLRVSRGRLMKGSKDLRRISGVSGNPRLSQWAQRVSKEFQGVPGTF